MEIFAFIKYKVKSLINIPMDGVVLSCFRLFHSVAIYFVGLVSINGLTRDPTIHFVQFVNRQSIETR